MVAANNNQTNFGGASRVTALLNHSHDSADSVLKMMMMMQSSDGSKDVTTFLTMFIINIYLLMICKQIIFVMVANFKPASSFSSLLMNLIVL